MERANSSTMDNVSMCLDPETAEEQAMTPTITSDLVEAYSQCPRKAFLMMTEVVNPGAHEYVRITDDQAAANRQAYRARLGQAQDFPPRW